MLRPSASMTYTPMSARTRTSRICPKPWSRIGRSRSTSPIPTKPAILAGVMRPDETVVRISILEPPMPLHLLHDGFAEQAARTEDQDEDQDDERDDVLVAGGQEARRQGLDDPEREAAQDRTAEVA